MVQKEPAVQAVLRARRGALDAEFRAVAGEGGVGKPALMSMDAFMKELFERKARTRLISRDLRVTSP